MINLKTTLFILAGFLIATTTAEDQLMTAGIMNTMFAQPLTVDGLLSSPLLIAPSPSFSACGPNEVEDANHVCIKPDYIEGCQIYETFFTCSKCALGYSLNKDKKCVYITTFSGSVTHIKGCIRQTDSVCDTCAKGFYSKDNKCALGVRNCVAYNKDGECTECEHHFSLILSQCRKNGLLGCKYEAESHTCTECYPPFTLNGQHCEIDQCRILNDYGCVACECGYYLSIDRQCKPISQGCLRYEKGICKNCLPHYKLKGGVCEIEGCVEYSGSYCKRCSEKYDLINGECKFKNCLDWLNDQCITCAKGFGLKNGLCVTATTVTCA